MFQNICDLIIFCVHITGLIERLLSCMAKLFFCIYPKTTIFSLLYQVFGCIYFVQDLNPSLDKLSLRSIKCIFVDYYRTQKGTSVMIHCLENILFLLILLFLSPSHFASFVSTTNYFFLFLYPYLSPTEVKQVSILCT